MKKEENEIRGKGSGNTKEHKREGIGRKMKNWKVFPGVAGKSMLEWI